MTMINKDRDAKKIQRNLPLKKGSIKHSEFFLKPSD